MKQGTGAGKKKTPAVETGKIAEPVGVYLPAKMNGLVSWFIHGQAKYAKKQFHPTTIIELVGAGLPMAELETLRDELDLPMEKLAGKIGVSKTTLHRRKSTGRLDSSASDKVVRFARLFGKAVKILGSEQEGRRWLLSKQFGLGGAVPLDYAETEVGAREVENLLTRIDYGVYS